jgi:hypothetical protein
MYEGLCVCTFAQHECEGFFAMSSHIPLISRQHAFSSGESWAIGNRQAMAGTANSQTSRKADASLAKDFNKMSLRFRIRSTQILTRELRVTNLAVPVRECDSADGHSYQLLMPSLDVSLPRTGSASLARLFDKVQSLLTFFSKGFIISPHIRMGRRSDESPAISF